MTRIEKVQLSVSLICIRYCRILSWSDVQKCTGKPLNFLPRLIGKLSCGHLQNKSNYGLQWSRLLASFPSSFYCLASMLPLAICQKVFGKGWLRGSKSEGGQKQKDRARWRKNKLHRTLYQQCLQTLPARPASLLLLKFTV